MWPYKGMRLVGTRLISSAWLPVGGTVGIRLLPRSHQADIKNYAHIQGPER